MRTRVTLAAVTLALIVGVAAGWLYENRSKQESEKSPTAAESTYRVRVTRDGRELASFDVTDLQAIGMKTVVVQGGTERGPVLLDVLRRAGVTDFAAITVLGLGIRDEGRLEVPRSAIDSATVLDVAKRGTVKIAGPAISREMRVRDVTEIQVR